MTNGSKLGQAFEALRTKGPKEGIRFVWERGRGYLYELDRTIIMLRVDLTNAKNRIRDRDRDEKFELLELKSSLLPEIDAMLAKVEPARVGTPKIRLQQGNQGLVARYDSEIIGYVFWRPGSDDPAACVHPDLTWVPMRPRQKEVYTFDYFIAQSARGRGNLFARAVQQAHFDMGYEAACGYVYEDNRAALWLYRTIGWKEVGRVVEHKFLSRFAVIQDRLYRIDPFKRTLLGAVPKGLLK